MLAHVTSAALSGIDAKPVQVEVDVSEGLPVFTIVGLPDLAVRESRERIQAAFKNSGLKFPARRITVNLAPADVRKAGTAFDLPISLALLAAIGGSEREEALRRKGAVLAVGELALEGTLRPVRGILSMAIMARQLEVRTFLVPQANGAEAQVVEGVRVQPLHSLGDALGWLDGLAASDGSSSSGHDIPLRPDRPFQHLDMSDIRGQAPARRALEVAAAGGHNLLLVGPPGTGKTMLARRLPTILPTMTLEEAMLTTRIHSASGRLPHGRAILFDRPYRAPHHTISDSGLIGGGPRVQPGEVSLAHNGVLFLDELPEFRRNVLEALRQPLEEGVVTVNRAMTTVRYPAQAMVVAAMNLCPCGKLGNPRKDCQCTEPQRSAYRSRISGPLLDRFDIQVQVPSLDFEEMASAERGEPSLTIRERVAGARDLQELRFAARPGPRLNSRMMPAEILQWSSLDEAGRNLLRRAISHFGLSARAHDRILKVARTIADLAEAGSITAEHVAEAIQYRCLDRDET